MPVVDTRLRPWPDAGLRLTVEFGPRDAALGTGSTTAGSTRRRLTNGGAVDVVARYIGGYILELSAAAYIG